MLNKHKELKLWEDQIYINKYFSEYTGEKRKILFQRAKEIRERDEFDKIVYNRFVLNSFRHASSISHVMNIRYIRNNLILEDLHFNSFCYESFSNTEDERDPGEFFFNEANTQNFECFDLFLNEIGSFLYGKKILELLMQFM